MIENFDGGGYNVDSKTDNVTRGSNSLELLLIDLTLLLIMLLLLQLL